MEQEIKQGFVPKKDMAFEQYLSALKGESRTNEVIFDDMKALWKQNPHNCVKSTVLIRQAAGSISLPCDGLQNEAITRLYWLAANQKATFAVNVAYFIQAGSWKDLICLMVKDLIENSWETRKLDWLFLRSVIAAGLVNEYSVDAVRATIPSIKIASELTTDVAKATNTIGKFLVIGFIGKPDKEGDFSSYKKYRKLKAHGTAEEWASVLEESMLKSIDFNRTKGKSLSMLVGPSYLKKKGLWEDYRTWIINSVEPKELLDIFKPFGLEHLTTPLPDYAQLTIDAQFEKVIARASKNPNIDSRTLVVRDISSSMEGAISNSGMSSYSLAKTLAMFFAKLNIGYFNNKYLVFTNEGCAMRELNGNTATEMWQNDSEIIYSEKNSLKKISDYFGTIQGTIAEGELPRHFLVITDDNILEESEETFKADMLSHGYSENYVNSISILKMHVANDMTADAVSEKFFFNIAKLTGSKYNKVKQGTERELYIQALNQDLLKRIVVIKMKKSVQFAKKGTSKA